MKTRENIRIACRHETYCKGKSMSLAFILFLALFATSLTGCSKSVAPVIAGGSPDSAFLSGAVSSGVVVVARSMPEVSAPDFESTMLGFMPIDSLSGGENWVVLDLEEGSLRLMDGRDTTQSFLVNRLSADLPSGNYTVQLMQRNALWYAPEQYFLNRGLEIPPEGAGSRFLKGALGPQVIYLTEDIFIHSSPLYSEEVGGIQLEPQALDQLAGSLELGSVFVVR